MLTRRIGLEPVVLQYPALARAPAPSEQGTTHDETSAGPLSTGWEQPVDNGPPSKEQWSLSGSPGRVLCIRRGVSQHRRHLGRCGSSAPSRGKARSGPYKPNGLRERAARPGWARTGRASARRRWILQPAYPRARDRRCPSDADWGISQSSTRPSRVDVIAGCLCGESRSGPDPWKLGRRDDRKVKLTSLVTVSKGGPNLCGHGVNQVRRSSGAVLVDRIGRKQGALGRGSASPLTRRRAETVLVLPLSVGSQIP